MPRPKWIAGDVFATRTSDGRYTAVRVIRRVGKSSLVCTTSYLALTPPNLDHPALLTNVVQVRFAYKGQAAMKWLTGAPPSSFEKIGNIQPNELEQRTDCNVYGGAWSEGAGQEAFMEWRWIHDRLRFEEEVQQRNAAAERQRRRPQTPKKMMTDDEFWPIVESFDWRHQGNDDAVLAPAVKALARLSKADICRFEERLAHLLYELDTREHALASVEERLESVSADGFLYARCVVVANGRKFYDQVLRDSSKMPKEMEFESLLTLARSAHEVKTGRDLDYSTGCSYESFSNTRGWEGGGGSEKPARARRPRAGKSSTKRVKPS